MSEPPVTQGWPRVVGGIAIGVGVLMLLDKLDDLLLLPVLRSQEWWRSLLGEQLAAEVVRWMPPAGWIVLAGLVHMALGVLLLLGGLRLRRARRSGVALCRSWSWLALCWLAVETSWALYWLAAHAHELRALAPGEWVGPAVVSLVVTLVVLAAFPVFLLTWLSRPAVRDRWAAWPL